MNIRTLLIGLIACLPLSHLMANNCYDFTFSSPDIDSQIFNLTSIIQNPNTNQTVAVINGQKYVVGKDKIGSGKLMPGQSSNEVQITYQHKKNIILSLHPSKPRNLND